VWSKWRSHLSYSLLTQCTTLLYTVHSTIPHQLQLQHDQIQLQQRCYRLKSLIYHYYYYRCVQRTFTRWLLVSHYRSYQTQLAHCYNNHNMSYKQQYSQLSHTWSIWYRYYLYKHTTQLQHRCSQLQHQLLQQSQQYQQSTSTYHLQLQQLHLQLDDHISRAHRTTTRLFSYLTHHRYRIRYLSYYYHLWSLLVTRTHRISHYLETRQRHLLGRAWWRWCRAYSQRHDQYTQQLTRYRESELRVKARLLTTWRIVILRDQRRNEVIVIIIIIMYYYYIL
jgi:hypothetical protein